MLRQKTTPAADAESFSFARARLLIRRDLLMTPTKTLLYLPFFYVYFVSVIYIFMDSQDRKFIVMMIISYYLFFTIFPSSLASGYHFPTQEVLTRIRMPMTRLEMFAVDVFYFLVMVPALLFIGVLFLAISPLQQELNWRLIMWIVAYFPASGFFVWFFRAPTKSVVSSRFSWWGLIKEVFNVAIFLAFGVFILFVSFVWAGGVPEGSATIYSIFALMLTPLFWIAAYRKYARY